MPAQDNKAKIGILGASGYTGAELLRLLLLGTGHACVQIIRARHGSSGREGVLGMFEAVWVSMHYR